MKAFIQDQGFSIDSIPEFIKLSPIDLSDPLLELVPEAYLDSKPLSPTQLQEGIEQLVRENAALIIRYKREKEVK